MATIDCKCSNANCCFSDTCCWCSDKRCASDVKTYVDEYGFLGIDYIPRDIHYCVNCRDTTDSLTVLVEKLRAYLSPEEYHRMTTSVDRESKTTAKIRLAVRESREREKRWSAMQLERSKIFHSPDSQFRQISMAGKSNRERRKGPQTR